MALTEDDLKRLSEMMDEIKPPTHWVVSVTWWRKMRDWRLQQGEAK